MAYNLVNRNFDRLFDQVFNPAAFQNFSSESFSPRFSFSEDDSAYYLTGEVPGVKKENLKIELKGDALKISGFRGSKEASEESSKSPLSYARFEKCFRLGNNIDLSSIDAKQEDGVLVLSIPKSKEAQSRFIDVK